jgi:hypothetical protein
MHHALPLTPEFSAFSSIRNPKSEIIFPLTPEFSGFSQSEIRIPQSEMLPSPLYLSQ